MKILLPQYTKKGDSKAHKFPFQIGHQTLEFLQASIFHASFCDMAAGEYVRMPGAMSKIDAIYINGLSKSDYENAWKCLDKYKIVFENAVLANVLITLCSHWDWYVRRLADFIIFSLNHINKDNIHKDLDRIGRLPFLLQIELLERACGIKFNVSQDVKDQLKEMTLVRNLGLHNRWEIDSKYLSISNNKELEIGDLRIVKIEELQNWHKALMTLISQITYDVAKLYANVPEFK